VRFHVRERWLGWNDDDTLRFAHDGVDHRVRADATVLALGGASWPVLGSDGAWVPLLRSRGVAVETLQPSNCGFDVGWSEHFAKRHAGDPVKPVILEWNDADGTPMRQQGEFVVTATGVEGSLIYAMSARLRDAIASRGSTEIRLDLAPGRDIARLERDLTQPTQGRSLSEVLRRRVGIDGVKAGLLREVLGKFDLADPSRIAAAIKSLPLSLLRPRPIEEAISSAGGVAFEGLDESLMLKPLPGVFCAGEMIDWEAPTGGYLLTACFASGRIAGRAAADFASRSRG